jgi:SEC-C motif
MVTVGRNDPCPCSSGKKYKFCCQNKPKQANTGSKATEAEFARQYATMRKDPEWLKLRTAEGEIEEIFDRYIEKEFDQSIYETAWSEFELFGDYPVDRQAYAPYFKSWLYYSWVAETEFALNDDETTIAQMCLQEYPELFTAYQKQVIEAIGNAPFSFFIVQDVILEQRLFLKDIMLRKEVVVKEHMGTRAMKKGGIVLCRPITLDGQSAIVGLCPYVVPNRFFDEIVEYRDQILRTRKWTAFVPEKLIDYGMEFRELYLSIMEEAFQPMQFSNNDREPIVLNEIFYDLKCTPREVFDALLLLCPPSRVRSWEEGKFDADGNFVEIAVSWLRMDDSAAGEICDNISLGNFTITPTGLKVFVNSNERAAKAKEVIQNILGAKVAFKSNKTTPMSTSEDLKKTAMELGPKRETMKPTPEMIKVLKEYMAKHWVNWLDNEIPVLGGMTPRQAVKSESGREKLEALFLDFDSGNKDLVARGEDHQQVDIDFLKKELGMMS